MKICKQAEKVEIWVYIFCFQLFTWSTYWRDVSLFIFVLLLMFGIWQTLNVGITIKHVALVWVLKNIPKIWLMQNCKGHKGSVYCVQCILPEWAIFTHSFMHMVMLPMILLLIKYFRRWYRDYCLLLRCSLRSN